MAFTYLKVLEDTIRADIAVMALIDDQVASDLHIEQIEPMLKYEHMSCLNLMLASWNGEPIGIQALYRIEIRSRVDQAYVYEIAEALRDLLEHGFSATYEGVTYKVYVSKVEASLSRGETPSTYLITQTVYGSLTSNNTHWTIPTIASLTSNLLTPQKIGSIIRWTCQATDEDGDEILYRFLLKGPGTGDIWTALTGWMTQNTFDWKPTHDDIGSNLIRVQVIDGYHAPRGSYDAYLDSEDYTIQDNELPVLSALTPSLASPRLPGTTIIFAATASDAEGDWILYRFWHAGPATAGVWQDMTGWITKNIWSFKPVDADEGLNLIRVDIIDQKHAGRSGYDATLTVNYTIGTNNIPTIDSFTPDLASPQIAGKSIVFTCAATDVGGSGLYYRFLVTGPGTGDVARFMTPWTKNKNWFTWETSFKDIGNSTIEVRIRDGLHAGQGSYDDHETLTYIIGEPAPITSVLTANQVSPQVEETKITFVCTATHEPNNAVQYRFLLNGPSTGFVDQDMTGWNSSNSWQWATTSLDVGTNTIKSQVRYVGATGFDLQSMTFVITENIPPVILSMEASPVSPQVSGTPIKITVHSYDAEGDALVYKFLKCSSVVGSLSLVCNTPSSAYCNGVAMFSNGMGLAITNDAPALWRTIDNGKDWISISIPGDLQWLDSIAAFPNGIALLTGEMPGDGWIPKIYRTTNYGLSWTLVYTYPSAIDNILRLTTHPSGVALASGCTDGYIIRSADFGANWAQVYATGFEAVYGGFCIFNNGVALGGYDSMVRSTDWGANWSPVAEGGGIPSSDSIYCISCNPETGYALIGSDAGRIYYTDDYGLTYSLLFDLGTSSSTNVGCVILTTSGLAFCTVDNCLYVSYNSGASFSQLYSFPLVTDTIKAIAAPSGSLIVLDDYYGAAQIYRADTSSGLYMDMTGWETLNTYTWMPTRNDVGSHGFMALVRDQHHAGSGSYDAYEVMTFVVLDPAPLLISLTPDLASPQPSEVTITFTATASRTSAIYYRFWQKGPGTGNVWQDETGWTTKNTWAWRTADCDVGTNYIRCEVIDLADHWDDGILTSRRIDITYVIS